MNPAPAKTAQATKAVAMPSILTGYVNEISLLGTRYKQGQRTVYSIDLSLEQIANLIEPPNPNKASPGNRAVRPQHAESFAKYLRQNDNWVAPGILLRTAKPFEFQVVNEVAGAEFGVITFPRRAAADLHIIDGQHRILGINVARRTIAEDLDRARSNVAKSRSHDPGGPGEREARARVDQLEREQVRLDNERVNVQIIVESDEKEYRQMFFDIADNALGITASVKSRFDSRKVVNRALPLTSDHVLLTGRVDPEGDRIRGNSQFMLGAKHVAEIIRTVNVGLDGRVGKRNEDELKEADLAHRTKMFFDILIEAFPPMRAVSLGQLTPEDLRKTSLLGSVLFLRILAGVFFDLTSDMHHWEPEMVEAYFKKLASHVTGPTYEGDIWTEHVPDGIYNPGMFSPRSRRQDLRALKDAMVDWAITREPFLDKAPAPRPIALIEPESILATEDEEREMARLLRR